MTKPLRLGIAGLGTVGIGVVKIIRRQAAMLEARTGRPIVITLCLRGMPARIAAFPCQIMPGKRILWRWPNVTMWTYWWS